MSHFQVNTELQ